MENNPKHFISEEKVFFVCLLTVTLNFIPSLQHWIHRLGALPPPPPIPSLLDLSTSKRGIANEPQEVPVSQT